MNPDSNLPAFITRPAAASAAANSTATPTAPRVPETPPLFMSYVSPTTGNRVDMTIRPWNESDRAQLIKTLTWAAANRVTVLFSPN